MEYYTNFDSSNVSKIGYENGTSTLQVEFHNGGIYEYFDVPENIWEEFKSAESKGQFLSQYIKGQYRYAKV